MTQLNKLGNESAKVVCIAGTKGGIGKTMTTANIAGALADLGLRVLAIDCDEQASLSKYYGITQYADFGFKELIQNGSAEGCISKTVIDGLDIIVNNETAGEVNTFIKQNPSQRLYFLFSILKHSPVAKAYDAILIDTTGTKDIGGKQELAIRASDLIISPIEPTWISSKELAVTAEMINSLEPLAGMVSVTPVPPVTFFFNNVKKTKDTELVIDLIQGGGVYENLKRILGDKMKVLDLQVPSLEIYNKSVFKGEPIHRAHTQRSSENSISGKEVMKILTTEIFPQTKDWEFKN